MSIKTKSPTLLTPQSSAVITPRNNKNHRNFSQANENILIKTCCPNCRYVFQIVNEQKLDNIKDKIQKLSSIREEKAQIVMTSNYEKPMYEIQRTKIPNITSEKLSKVDKNVKKETKPPIKTPTPKKTPQRKQQTQEDSIVIKQSIEQMKKYLKAVSKGQDKKIKSHTISVDDDPSPRNNSELNCKDVLRRSKLQIENYSSIPRERIEISRKCVHCNSGHIQIQTAMAAAKSKLMQTQLLLMSRFIEKQTSTPSYIKCLQQITQTS